MFKIVFQNENFIVCDKAAQVLSVPAREKSDLRPCLGLQLQQQLNRQVFPVHRLDFEVSGLIIYALTSESHKKSQQWFLNKQIQKKYISITSPQSFSHWPANTKTDRSVISAISSQSFYWKTQLLRGKKRTFESTHGEWAETKASLDSFNESTNELRWTLLPVTGKPHQLRFELSRHGFPIWGDQLYGSKVSWKFPGIALRAIELNLRHVENRMGLPEVMKTATWDL